MNDFSMLVTTLALLVFSYVSVQETIEQNSAVLL